MSKHALTALLSLIDDCATLQETLLQWMSSSPRAREIDRELGDLRHDLVAQALLVSYLRYNLDLRSEAVQSLKPDVVDAARIESLSAMDAPENMTLLYELGVAAAVRDVSTGDFAANFDLPKE